ncbi:unnamed protein product [Haemonchus placei]|uniref:Secreted protein n=1 Tax=Haemonchus placei TaxID=6290 RepID=A0A0N4W7B5_HAEPC|nr:unnamed protein product [Haemonchus placei]
MGPYFTDSDSIVVVAAVAVVAVAVVVVAVAVGPAAVSLHRVVDYHPYFEYPVLAACLIASQASCQHHYLQVAASFLEDVVEKLEPSAAASSWVGHASPCFGVGIVVHLASCSSAAVRKLA